MSAVLVFRFVSFRFFLLRFLLLVTPTDFGGVTSARWRRRVWDS